MNNYTNTFTIGADLTFACIDNSNIRFQPGDRLRNEYEIISILGRGTFGEVYKVRCIEDNNIYAIKALRTKKYNTLRLFLKEVYIWSKLGYTRYIVRMHRVITYKGEPFIVLEYVGGLTKDGASTLDDYLKNNDNKELKHSLTIAIQLCMALRCAGKNGVSSHRDIKPQNILLTHEGNVKLTDFGISLLEKEMSCFKNREESKIIMGTKGYIDPIYYRNVEVMEYSWKNDIYAYGCVLWQLANHSPNLPYWHENLGKTIIAQEKFDWSAPKDVESIIKRCTTLNLEERYNNFDEIYHDLRNIQGMNGILPETEDQTNIHLSDKWYWFSLSQLHSVYLNDKMKGIEFSNNALRIDSKFPYAWCEKGTDYMHFNKYTEAEKCFLKAITYKPDYFIAHFNLGELYQKIGKIDCAIISLIKCLELDPDYTLAYQDLDNIINRANSDELSKIETCLLSLQNHDHNVVYIFLGKLYRRKKKYYLAIKSYLKCAPKYADARKEIIDCYCQNADIYQKKKYWARAAKIYDKILSLGVKNGVILHRKAVCLVKLRCCQEAREVMLECLKRCPSNHLYLCDMSHIYLRLRKWEEAIYYARKSIALYAIEKAAWVNLGIALYKKKRVKESRCAFRNALDIAPHDPIINRYFSRIQCSTQS